MLCNLSQGTGDLSRLPLEGGQFRALREGEYFARSFVMSTSDKNVSAAVRLASKLSPESNPIIVTIGCDSGEKYESKIYNDVWLRENNFL